MSAPIDPTVMLLRSFCLPTMAGQFEVVMERAEKEGWSPRQVLRHLCESEAVERAQRRTARLLAESALPETKTLSTLDQALLPAKVRRQLPALIEGGFVDRAVNVLAFGLPGRGKTHFLAALGRELILRHSRRVLFRPTFKVVAQLLAAKRDLRLESELKKLDRYEVLILDDIGYVQQSREMGFNPERSTLFYNKVTGQVVRAGEDSVAVGNSVFVKNPVYVPWEQMGNLEGYTLFDKIRTAAFMA